MGNDHQSTNSSFIRLITRVWKRLPENFRWNLEDTFQPEDISERLLPGEEPQLRIRVSVVPRHYRRCCLPLLHIFADCDTCGNGRYFRPLTYPRFRFYVCLGSSRYPHRSDSGWHQRTH